MKESYRSLFVTFVLLLMSLILFLNFEQKLEEYLVPKIQAAIKIASYDRQFKGTCSEDAWEIGMNQKVISYCFANYPDQFHLPFWRGFNQSLNNISNSYPGWQVRVYATGKDIEFLRGKVTTRDFLFFCDVDRLPSPLYNLTGVPIRMWRFAPMGDPQIELIIFRDIDSQIIQREIDAVDEWLSSNKTLHSMRDHLGHHSPILAGMWGLKMNDSNRNQLQHLRNQMFKLGNGSSYKHTDQTLLSRVIWPVFQNDVIAQDSYHCKRFKGSKPFPTKRLEGNFVAQRYVIEKPINITCPKKCRPLGHLDWKLC